MALPQEIWDKISRQLPPWSALTSSNHFRLLLDTSRQNHSRIWDLIFRNNNWLRIIVEQLRIGLVLIGADLKNLFDKSDSTIPSRLVLCPTQLSSNMQQYYSIFLQSLQPHKINLDGSITFPQSNLTLYYPTWKNKQYFLPNIQQFFQFDKNTIASAYLEFDTSSTYKYKQLGSECIAGKKGRKPTWEDIERICWIKRSSSTPAIMFFATEDIEEVLLLMVGLVEALAR
jgi:hypothetical protein